MNKKMINMLVKEIITVNVMQKRFVEKSIDSLTPEHRYDLDSYIQYCLKTGHSITFIAQCYNLLVKDTLNEQIYFKKHNTYRHSSYNEVSGSVYFNDDYMKQYMIGLALASFLWPNHVTINQLLTDTLPKEIDGLYLEIGPGHGFNFIHAIKTTRYSKFTGIDISPSSVELTKNILKSGFFGEFFNYDIIQQDFLSWNTNAKFDAIIMGEVLEHVENPVAFLKKIKNISMDTSYINITTCINTPAIDHIYLYRSLEEIENHVRSAGLCVKKTLSVPYGNTTLSESEAQSLPVNVAMILGNHA